MSREDFEHWWITNEPKTTQILLALRSGYGNVIDIEDLKSETFVRCWASNPKSADDGYGAWIWKVAKSVIGDVLREEKKMREVCFRLIHGKTSDPPASIVVERLMVRCRLDILMELYVGWGKEGRRDWDARQTKRRLLDEMARRVRLDRPISRKALAQSLGVSPRHVNRLLQEIASEVLQIEDAQVQSVRR